MQKVTFQIIGLADLAGAAQLEKMLKQIPGVLNAKVNFESKKGAAAYDETIVNENVILTTVHKTGPYETLKIDPTPSPMSTPSSTPTHNGIWSLSPAALMFVGFLSAFSILSLIINITLAVVLLRRPSTNTIAIPNGQAQAQPQPSGADANTPPPVQSFTITKEDHILGSFNAPVTLVEFSDFQCPYCSRHYPTLKQIAATYGNKVRIVYKHFPLSEIHPYAIKAAEASECAGEQNKFWEFHDKVFENQQALSFESLKQWAKEIGLNATTFNTCLDSGKFTAKVQQDYQEGVAKGVQGTPATFVNGKLVVGARPLSDFQQAIDAELKK